MKRLFLAASAAFLAVGPSFAQMVPIRDRGGEVDGAIRSAVEDARSSQERRAAFDSALRFEARGIEESRAGEESELPPSSKGQPIWHYLTSPLLGAQAVRTRVADGWSLDTTRNVKDSAGFFSVRLPLLGGIMSRPKIDRRKGFSLHFRLAVRSETHLRPERAGCSVIVLGDDLKGVELGFWGNEIWAQKDEPLFTHGEGAVFDTSQTVDYELRISGDRYELDASGLKILEGALKDYSKFGFPYDRRNFLFYGDDTGSASVDMEIGSLRAEYGPSTQAPGVAAE
jgi:hypothetical protein